MKKTLIATLIACIAVAFTSCDNDLKWHDTTDTNINYWMRTNLFLFFVNENNKQYFSLDNPHSWPVITDKVLTDAEVQTALENMTASEQTTTIGGTNSETFNGYTFSDNNGFIAIDSYYGMAFITPSVKIDNSGKTTTYLYIPTSEGIDVDTLTTNIRYAKEDGETYSEIKSIYYNKNQVYAKGGNSVGVVIQK
jgi:hypothetical protein